VKRIASSRCEKIEKKQHTAFKKVVVLDLHKLRTLGPSDDRSVRATLFAAWMFAFCASMPRIRDLVPESCDVYEQTVRVWRGSLVRQRTDEDRVGTVLRSGLLAKSAVVRDRTRRGHEKPPLRDVPWWWWKAGRTHRTRDSLCRVCVKGSLNCARLRCVSSSPPTKLCDVWLFFGFPPLPFFSRLRRFRTSARASHRPHSFLVTYGSVPSRIVESRDNAPHTLIQRWYVWTSSRNRRGVSEVASRTDSGSPSHIESGEEERQSPRNQTPPP